MSASWSLEMDALALAVLCGNLMAHEHSALEVN